MTETAAHTGALAGEPSFPPFQAENFASQLVWLTLTFVLLYVLMSRIALPRIGAIMADRSKQIAEDTAAARSFNAQAEATQAAREQALAAARRRAQEAISLERERHAAAHRDASARLNARLHERLTASEQSIAATRAAAMANVRTVAAELVPAIVQRLTGKSPAAVDVTAAIAEHSVREGSVDAHR